MKTVNRNIEVKYIKRSSTVWNVTNMENKPFELGMFGDDVTNNILGHLNNLSADFPKLGDLRTHVKSKPIKLQKVPRRSWRSLNENEVVKKQSSMTSSSELKNINQSIDIENEHVDQTYFSKFFTYNKFSILNQIRETNKPAIAIVQSDNTTANHKTKTTKRQIWEKKSKLKKVQQSSINSNSKQRGPDVFDQHKGKRLFGFSNASSGNF